MQIELIIAVAIHVLAAVFWAGSTFVMARSAALGAEGLWRAQLGAAAVTALTGGYLWFVLHRGVQGSSGKILAAGIVAALVALTLQMALGAVPAHALERDPDNSSLRKRLTGIQRASAPLLALTIICMAVWRYV